ncbi:MAG: AAC(3) family N-acetyltransferase [Gemmatimonadota bacterium]|nr:AAC(3) family N-acetyltransferase [Gemmatimonadota bacterium]
MARLTADDFKRQLADVVRPGDELVVVYSGIWTFGHRFAAAPADVPKVVLDAMLESLGPNQTLLLPSYTYNFTKTRVYSPRDSTPETGVLPVTMHESFPHVRTRSALNSFLASGPRAEELANVRGQTLWGEGSLKHHFQRQHARIVVLGLPWEAACGFLHRIEEEADAPYRYHKTFRGTWDEYGKKSDFAETMFVRPLAFRPVFKWAMVDQLLRSRNQILKSAGEIFLESADASDIVAAGREIVDDDPYALIANVDDVRDWVKNGKAAEIEALRAEDPGALEYHDRLTASHTH